MYFVFSPGGIEKAHVVLAAFDKTDLLAPGESQTLTLRFAKEDMASYDYKDAKAYVLEQGPYEIKLMKNSHEVINQRTYVVEQTVFDHASDITKATNQFDDLDTGIQYVSRADWEGTMPKERGKDQTPSPELVAALQKTTVETRISYLPITGSHWPMCEGWTMTIPSGSSCWNSCRSRI